MDFKDYLGEAEKHVKLVTDKIPQQAQRQDALNDQLRDLRVVANRLGMYDAADFLRGVIERK